MRVLSFLAAGVIFAVASLGLGACDACQQPPPARDGQLAPPAERQPLELEPLPVPPAVAVTPGSIAGIPAGPVTVVVARPQGATQRDERPSITFNKPLIALGDRESTPAPAVRIDPSVEGAWHWIGSSSVEFVPQRDLPWATRFTVTVDAGLTAIDGSRLEKPYSFSFDTLAPAFVRTEPSDGWRWLPPDGKIQLFFNQPVRRELIEKTVRVTANGALVPFELSAVVDVAEEKARERGVVPPRPNRFGREMRYELTPRQTLPLGARIRVDVLPGLRAEEGPLEVTPRGFQIQVMGPMKFLSARACEPWREQCPHGPVVLYATNEPDLTSLRGKIRFEPPAEIDEDELSAQTSSTEGAWVSIPARFRPGTTYKLIVDAGGKDAIGQSAPGFTATVKLNDVSPDLRVESSNALLEASGDGSYPVEVVNVAEVNARIEPLTPPQMMKLLLGDARAPLSDVTPIEKRLDTSSEKNVAVRRPLPLADVFSPGTPRLFRLTLSAVQLNNPQIVLGQITDLAVHAKLGSTSGVVWVTSLAKGTPVEGASVALYAEDGSVFAEARTDADGIARVPGAAGMKSDRRWRGWSAMPDALVAVTKDGDTGVTLSSWDGEIGPPSAGMDLTWEGPSSHGLGVVVTDRGIYRPGDDVYVKGLVRTRREGKIALPRLDGELELRVSSGGKEIARERVTLTRFGTFSTKVRVPQGASLGWYSAVAKAMLDGNAFEVATEFRVEEYRAPRFKVDVKLPVAHLVAGDSLLGRTEARSLFGGAMPGADVQATVLREAQDFAPTGFEKWQFGIQTWGFDDGTPGFYGDVFARRTGSIGTDGGLDLDFGVVEAPAGRTARYTVEAEVSDVSRQRVANRASLVVHPASVYVGVRAGDDFGKVGTPLPVELVTVDVEGHRVGGVALAVAIKRREWKSVRKRDPYSGRFITISEVEELPVTTCERVSDASAPVRCEVTPEKPGLYVVEATATDARGRKQVTKVSTYVAGDGWVSWQRTEGEMLELVADKRVYEPGETARVLIKSPWPEAEALITFEREGVSLVRRQRLKGSAVTVDLPIDDDSIPNVFASVVLVRGRVDAGASAPKEIDPGRPQVRVGYVRLAVEKKKKMLDVTIDAGQGPRRPGERMKIKLAVRDVQKKGVPAEVALWAVDEAVLRLTDYDVRDPIEAIHPPRGLSVHLGESLIFLVRQQGYGEKGRPPGGDGGASAGAGFRSNFKTTAFFLPSVETDATGNAEVEVQLPDDLTTYRVMALAVNEGDLAGTGRTDIVVQKPLLALPALPRLARVGDRFEAGVVVHANRPGDVDVTVDAQGLKLLGDRKRSIVVDGARGVEVRFPFEAEHAGRARLRFEVKGGAERDGVEQLLPIVSPAVVETVAAAGDTADRREERLAPPAGVLSDVGGLDVTLASTALAGFQEALQQLVEYPYGCAEQLSSRLVPFIAVRELQGAFGLKHEGGAADQELFARWLGFAPDAVASPDEVAQRTVSALQALQTQDGGMRYWPSSRCADPLASAWGTLALSRAKELGYPVEEKAVERGQRFLADRVAVDKLPSCDGPHRASLVERTFALWVLARTGKPSSALLEELFQKRNQLPVFGKAMLADAHFIGGAALAKSPRAVTLLQEVMNGARESAREVHFEETTPGLSSSAWSSDVRTTAIVLMTLVDGVPEHPFVQKAAAWLHTARKGGRYRTTQEAAFALMALTELVRAKEREAPDFRASISLGGKQIAAQEFRGRSLDIIHQHVPMRDLGSKAASVVFEKQGTGTLSYTASLRYAKAEMPTTPLDAGLTVQRWFEPWASKPGTGQARRIRAGELVRLRVRVATHTERRFAVVDVPVPAGLELVDASLASSAAATLNPSTHGDAYDGQSGEDGGDREYGEEGEYGEYGEYGDDDGSGQGSVSSWTPFNHTELRDDRAVVFADVLPPGVHSMTLVARATTVGRFVLKPATAEEMYAPEVSGRSDGGVFEVMAQ